MSSLCLYLFMKTIKEGQGKYYTIERNRVHIINVQYKYTLDNSNGFVTINNLTLFNTHMAKQQFLQLINNYNNEIKHYDSNRLFYNNKINNTSNTFYGTPGFHPRTEGFKTVDDMTNYYIKQSVSLSSPHKSGTYVG
jgi:hypothetical protein